jgi:hypothetical protein
MALVVRPPIDLLPEKARLAQPQQDSPVVNKLVYLFMVGTPAV